MSSFAYLRKIADQNQEDAQRDFKIIQGSYRYFHTHDVSSSWTMSSKPGGSGSFPHGTSSSLDDCDFANPSLDHSISTSPTVESPVTSPKPLRYQLDGKLEELKLREGRIMNLGLKRWIL